MIVNIKAPARGIAIALCGWVGCAIAAPAPVAAPPATRAAQHQLPFCDTQPGQPKALSLSVGKSSFIALDDPVSRLTVGNPEVLEARLVSARGLYLLGGRVGSTNLILQGRGVCEVFDVSVGLDPAALAATLANLMPREKDIHITSAADSLVLTGQVSHAVAAEQVVAIATAFVRSAAGDKPESSGAGKGSAQSAAMARVVNMLSVSAPQQVMLEVKVAEVSKTLLDQLGVRFSATRNPSWGSVALLSDFLTGLPGGQLDIRHNGRERILLEAEKKDGLVRILAEPTVMAVSGQEGSFLAGGKILIPVAQNNTGSSGTTITLEEKEFGVGLKFTPTVLADGRINLRVSPEVSELSREGVGITATGTLTASSVLPLITTRRASTTVQLFDGQSFAIGGLIKNSASANVKAYPFLGEIPVLGVLFRSTDFQSERSELVFVVTPRLAKPLPPNSPLPTDVIGEPNRRDIMLKGRIDSDGGASPTKGGGK